jgi:hypothetical protein
MFSEQERRPLQFRLTVALAIAVLSLAVVGLTLANVAQGPRLLAADINLRAAVERGGQLLVLQSDQPLTGVDPSRVSVEPAVPVEVSWRGATVEVRFVKPLRYATDYIVTAGVTSAATDADSTITYDFRTPPAEIYLLQRNGSADEETLDQIVRAVPGSAERTVIYSAARIQEFAISGPSLAVVTQDSESAGMLTVGPLNGSGPSKTLATDVVVTGLQASDFNGVFGFTVMPLSGTNQYQTQLHLYDPSTGDDPTGLLGLDNKPLAPQTWAFVPGTRTILAQTADTLFFLIDAATGSVKPLGGHSRMHGFVNGTATVIFEDGGRYVTLDLTAGTRAEIPLGNLVRSAVVYQLLALPDDNYVELAGRLEDSGIQLSIEYVDQGTFKTIYAPEPENDIPLVCLSPNGQYLAVEEVPAGNETDGYDVLPGYLNSRVLIIDSSTGNVQAEEAGFGADWCR